MSADIKVVHVETYEKLFAFVRTSGLRLAWVNWEIYGDHDDDASKLRTDIFHLLLPGQ